MQDRGHECCKSNATSGQHFRLDRGQWHEQDSQRNSGTAYSSFHFVSPLLVLLLTPISTLAT